MKHCPVYSFLPHTTKNSRSQVPVNSVLSLAQWLVINAKALLTCRLITELISITAAGSKWGSPEASSSAPASCRKWQPPFTTNKSRLRSIPVQFPLRHTMREIRSSQHKFSTFVRWNSKIWLDLIVDHKLCYSTHLRGKDP
jgi:hypothetical protein